MSTIFMTLLAILFLLVLISFILSFVFTRRYTLKNSRPSEVELENKDVFFKSINDLTLWGWRVPGSGLDKVIIQLQGIAGSMDADIQCLRRAADFIDRNL